MFKLFNFSSHNTDVLCFFLLDAMNFRFWRFVESSNSVEVVSSVKLTWPIQNIQIHAHGAITTRLTETCMCCAYEFHFFFLFLLYLYLYLCIVYSVHKFSHSIHVHFESKLIFDIRPLAAKVSFLCNSFKSYFLVRPTN